VGYGLIVTEKPSVAQSIAAVLGVNKRGDGHLEGGGWLISWCFGHLVELAPADAYGEQYKRWSYDTLPILPDVWKYKASDSKKKQLDILRSLMNRADVDSIVNACDAGREGELIFRLVYDQCKCRKPVQRLWISSLEDSAVREGFAKLRPGADYDDIYRAALCRAQADYVVGINSTRLFSCLYGTTLSVGRVQSPTLALIVSREEALRSFISEPFYTPEIYCGEFTASGEKLKEPEAAESVRAAADGRDAVVLSIEKQMKNISPPKLYDLTTLQREANRLFGYTAQQTLDYAQSLYEKKLVTYPRTDSRYLTSGMKPGLSTLVSSVAAILPFSIDEDPVINTTAVIKDSDVSDHHAIIPTPAVSGAELSSLPSGERDILHMIAVRLVCAVGSNHSYEAVTAVLECGGNTFTAKGRMIIYDGWKVFDDAFRSTLKNEPDKDTGESDTSDEGRLPELSKGQIFESVTATVKEGKTSPPKRYTEDTLLSAMETAGAEDFPDDAERKGLGTPATRAATIEKLIKSGFVERQKKCLVPTNKGVNLIAVLPEDIKSPLLTAEWEQKLKLVERGELAGSGFMDGIASLTRALVAAHRVPSPEYAALFVDANNFAAKHGGIIGACLRCGSEVSESATGFFCSNRACKFAMWKDNRFFGAKGKKLDKKTAAALLTEGRVFFSDLRREKTGKTYAATILLEDTGDRVNFKLDFTKGRDYK
jgi:DNA topoisomerase-3